MADDPAQTPPAPSVSQRAAEAWRVIAHLPASELVGVGAMAALVAAAFAPELAWMWGRWMASEYYGHGVLIPPVVAYLIYRRREAVAALLKAYHRLGLVCIAGGLLLHLAALQVDVNFVSGFALIPVIWGLVLWLWGWPVARALLFPVAYLAFAVPIDRLLVDAFSSPLQLSAAQMALVFARFLGIPVTREGVNLSVPEYTFEVAIACSGLKSLTTMTALAALFAYGVSGELWRRALLVASSVPVALFANAARVTVILLVARSFGDKAATGFLHGFSGVLVFAVGLVGLYGVGRLLRCYKLRDDI